MRGPLPSPTRKRREKPAYDTNVLPATGRTGRPPKPPEWITLGPAGQAWWRSAWGTPQATRWNRCDHPMIARRAALEDVLVAQLASEDGPSAAMLRVMLDLDAQLGLTPKALAMMRWRIGDPEAADAGSGDVVVLSAV